MPKTLGPHRYQVFASEARDARPYVVIDTYHHNKILARTSTVELAEEIAKQLNEKGRIEKV